MTKRNRATFCGEGEKIKNQKLKVKNPKRVVQVIWLKFSLLLIHLTFLIFNF